MFQPSRSIQLGVHGALLPGLKMAGPIIVQVAGVVPVSINLSSYQQQLQGIGAALAMRVFAVNSHVFTFSSGQVITWPDSGTVPSAFGGFAAILQPNPIDFTVQCAAGVNCRIYLLTQRYVGTGIVNKLQ